MCGCIGVSVRRVVVRPVRHVAFSTVVSTEYRPDASWMVCIMRRAIRFVDVGEFVGSLLNVDSKLLASGGGVDKVKLC